jgi:shikimate kinase
MPTFRTSRPVSADVGTPHVVLVGLPGAGKSTIGRAVAEATGRAFLDFDAEIERREGRSVAELFAERGEPAFRAKERALTEELATVGGMILSPGGGWVADPANIALLRPPAVLVWLKVKPETALTRMGPDHGARPLLRRPDPLGELRRLLAAREAQYASADHVVNTELVTRQQAIDRVIQITRAG